MYAPRLRAFEDASKYVKFFDFGGSEMKLFGSVFFFFFLCCWNFGLKHTYMLIVMGVNL